MGVPRKLLVIGGGISGLCAAVYDRVLSAADGHTTLQSPLGGRYTEPHIELAYAKWKPYPSYVQVSLGIAQDLSHLPGFGSRLLDAPLAVDPHTQLMRLSYRCFHFDPTFAPPGKTALTCFLPTYDCDYWTRLRERDPERYRAEKARIAGPCELLHGRPVGHARRGPARRINERARCHPRPLCARWGGFPEWRAPGRVND